MDVAPIQIASIAASLIPFLEHDDANRALMDFCGEIYHLIVIEVNFTVVYLSVRSLDKAEIIYLRVYAKR